MSDRLLLGTNKGLLILEKRGKTWEFVSESHRAIPVSYAMRDPRHDTLWACLDHGHWGTKLHRSHDDGATWEEVPAPKYPEGMEREPGHPATVSYIWCIVPGGQDQPNRLYVGTEPGGLFQSDDNGDNFHLVETLWNHPTRPTSWFGGGRDYAGLCSIVVDPRDSRHVTVGISVGGVYETCDGGETWQPRNKGTLACYLPDPHVESGQDPHYMTCSPSNPDVLWQQSHCGVFRSTDGGQNWQHISQPGGPVYFGFAIATDERDENTAWVVPAVADEFRMAINGSLMVCRTEDGGKTWQELRSGLPQKNCYDLTYRHALDITGDRLAFGTTTGNVFVSENRGDDWACIGNYFPPIFSVRFA